MIETLFLLTFLCGGSLLQAQVVPWTPGDSTCFAADMDTDGRAEVFVLEGQRLRIYGRRRLAPLLDLTLPEGAAALDIADVDRDGTAEAIVVRGEAILAIPLSDGGIADAQTLFELENQYSHSTGRPFPSTLVVDREGAPAIALPRSGVLEVRDLTGNLVESYPIGVQSPRHLTIHRPFSYWVSQYAQAGPNDALEFRISSVISYRTLETHEATPIGIAAPAARLGTGRQQHDAIPSVPESWPWFSIRAGAGVSIRALYRLEAAQNAMTAIRVRSLPDDATQEEAKIGPARYYPGALILRKNAAPDFNGDGYTDIMLWKTRQPSLTGDSISRAAATGTWPLSVTAHTFMPEKQRFTPRAAGHLTLQIPAAWWLSPSPNGPLRTVFLRDSNSDGKTDFGCLTSEDALSIWLMEDDGFSSGPAFHHEFPGPVGAVRLEADLDGRGSATLALECGETLQILRPWSPLADF